MSSNTTTLGTGTLTIDIGSWNSDYSSFTRNGTAGSQSITIDSTNNTLTGVRDAINSAAAGVTASIVNDGSGNRLVLSSSTTGAANGFRVTTTDADGNNTDGAGLSQLAFDPASGANASTHLADAANASFSLDGLAISKPGNHVTDVIDGLTLDLAAADTTKTTTFSISRDTATAKSNIGAFVNAYNAVVNNLGSLTSYNATSKTAGPLNGDSSMRLISTRLQSIVASVLPGGGNINSLGDIGIKFTDTGTLTIDDTKLSSVLSTNPDAIGRLFATTGTSSDSLVQYTGSTDNTQAGSHALSVSTLASKGATTGSAAANLTITAGVNDTVSVTVDNVATTITLSPGTYASADALATEVQSKINGTSALSTLGSSVAVTASNGALTVTSQRYGSASSVVIGGRRRLDRAVRHVAHHDDRRRCRRHDRRRRVHGLGPDRDRRARDVGRRLAAHDRRRRDRQPWQRRVRPWGRGAAERHAHAVPRHDQRPDQHCDRRPEREHQGRAEPGRRLEHAARRDPRADHRAVQRDGLARREPEQHEHVSHAAAHGVGEVDQQQLTFQQPTTGPNMHHQTPYGASAYRAIGIETGVAAADPLGLVVMLYDGAIQAILRAEASLASHDIEGRGAYTSKAIDIVRQGLAASLDRQIGGELAESLGALYDYMGQRLFTANLRGDINVFVEVRKLLTELRQSWMTLRASGHPPYTASPGAVASPFANRAEALQGVGRSLAA